MGKKIPSDTRFYFLSLFPDKFRVWLYFNIWFKVMPGIIGFVMRILPLYHLNIYQETREIFDE